MMWRIVEVCILPNAHVSLDVGHREYQEPSRRQARNAILEERQRVIDMFENLEGHDDIKQSVFLSKLSNRFGNNVDP